MINGSLADVPYSSALHHVPHSETLDGFVLWDCTRAVGTAEESYVATALFVAATISSFLGLRNRGSVIIAIKVVKRNGTSKCTISHPPCVSTVQGVQSIQNNTSREHTTGRLKARCTYHA